MSPSHSSLWQKHNKLLAENAKLSMENHRLIQENEKLSSQLDQANAHIKRIESGDDLPKPIVEKICANGLAKGQFGYTLTQTRLMLQKKKTYKKKGLLYRPAKWTEFELIHVCALKIVLHQFSSFSFVQISSVTILSILPPHCTVLCKDF